MSTVLSIRAHAKINLSLRVGPRRLDGFHELRTVYQSLALHDVLRVARRRGTFALTCSSPDVPADSSNLVFKAARAVWRRLGRRGDPRDVSIHLGKRIPMESGLGGGSSDAAAALVALNRVWSAKLQAADLIELAAGLGSDVPFFFLGGTALGLGRGEVVRPLPDAPPRAVVLVRPDAGVSTADAYGWFDADANGAPIAASSFDVPWPGSLVNDLEPPVVRRRPAIGEARRALLGAGALAAGMTGSGSAVFGIFETREAARTARGHLARPGWAVILTRTLGRSEYSRRARPETVRRAKRA